MQDLSAATGTSQDKLKVACRETSRTPLRVGETVCRLREWLGISWPVFDNSVVFRGGSIGRMHR